MCISLNTHIGIVCQMKSRVLRQNMLLLKNYRKVENSNKNVNKRRKNVQKERIAEQNQNISDQQWATRIRKFRNGCAISIYGRTIKDEIRRCGI